MIFSHYHRVRALLLAGIAACVAIFLFVARTFGIPSQVGFGGSILNEPAPLATLLVIMVTLVVCVLVGTLIAGTVRFDAGLFCALVGMSVLTLRAGTVGGVLRQWASTHQPGVMLWMALELVLLYGIIGLAWSALWLLHERGWLKGDEFRDGIEDSEDSLVMKFSALAMQAGVMALAMLLLAQVDAKMQSLIAVGAAAMAGAWAAHYVYPVSPSAWLWVGPLIVGVIGYVMAYFNPEGWEIGRLNFTLAGMARSLPMDYATAGPVGALLGYWMSRRAHRQMAEDPAEGETAEEAS